MHKKEITIETGRKNQAKFDFVLIAKVKINIEINDIA